MHDVGRVSKLLPDGEAPAPGGAHPPPKLPFPRTTHKIQKNKMIKMLLRHEFGTFACNIEGGSPHRREENAPPRSSNPLPSSPPPPRHHARRFATSTRRTVASPKSTGAITTPSRSPRNPRRAGAATTATPPPTPRLPSAARAGAPATSTARTTARRAGRLPAVGGGGAVQVDECSCPVALESTWFQQTLMEPIK